MKEVMLLVQILKPIIHPEQERGYFDNECKCLFNRLELIGRIGTSVFKVKPELMGTNCLTVSNFESYKDMVINGFFDDTDNK